VAREKKEKKEKEPQKAKKEKKEKTEKKGGKKKLLLILIPVLVLIAAGAFAVVRFVLPNLGGKEVDEAAKKPVAVENYEIGEDAAPALDTVFVDTEDQKEGRLLANRGPEKESKGEEPAVEGRIYIYEMENYASVVDRYLDLLMGEEQGFQLVDETYLILEERPELADEEGALTLAKTSVQEGRVFQLAIGWSQANGNLTIRTSVPEGQLHRPEKEKGDDGPPPASVREQLDALEQLTPAQLTLPGDSMSAYEIYPIEGFVTIDGNLCRRFNVYDKEKPGDIAGIIFYSGDMQHTYRMDVDDNTIITELK